jgi:quercetin dioxygenase-like cupin family protein
MSFFPPTENLSLVVLQPDQGKAIHVLGDTLSVKVTGAQTDGAMTVIQEASPPQGGPPLHVHHREDEAFYVLEGKYEVQCGDRKIEATPGSFVFAPRAIPHAFRNISSGPGKVLIMITPAGIEHFFEELGQLGQDKPGPPDLGTVKKIAAKYGIEILVHEDA